MRKVICKFLVTALAAVSLSGMTAFAKETQSLGDCNGDGIIDATDASAILSYYAAVSTGQTANWDKAQLASGDVNSDGQIDSSDASFVLAYYSYMSTISEDEPYVSMTDYFAEMTRDFQTEAPVVESVSYEDSSFEIKFDKNDEAEGYEVVLYYYTYVEDYDSYDPVMVTTDVKTADGTAEIDIPEITLKNTDYLFYSENNVIYPTPDFIGVVMTPYQTRLGRRVYKGEYYETLDPYSFVFEQQAGESQSDIPVYNVQGEEPYLAWTSHVSEADRKIFEEFEEEHFTDESFYERLTFMSKWIRNNFNYAYEAEDWNEIVNLSWADATINHKKGQCVQYNGALAEYAAYKGYNVKMIQGWTRTSTDRQHFWGVIELDDGIEFTLDLLIY